jgi:hypothetical protein
MGATTRRLLWATAVVALAIPAVALGGWTSESESDAVHAAAAVAPPVSEWGDTRTPYRPGSGRFCEAAAEGTSIRPDVVNRLVFLDPRDAPLLIAELRGRDRELVTAAPVELQGDLDAIAQAADRLYNGLEVRGFDPREVPDDVLGSLSARDLRPAFGRATTYLKEQCDIDIWAILSTV